MRPIQVLAQFNLFRDARVLPTANPQILRDQILATRVLLLLLTLSFSTLVLFTFLTEKLVSVTEPHPSLSTYQRLQAAHPNTLSCPCKQVAITYADFVTVTPKYHQVCSSDLISAQWIASLFNPDTAHFTPLDFRLTAALQFRLLSLVCWLSHQTITDQHDEFFKGQLITGRVLSPGSFADETDALIKKFFASMDMAVPANTATQLVMLVLSQSRIDSALDTDAFQSSVPGSNDYRRTTNFYPKYDNATFVNNTPRDFSVCNSFGSVKYNAGIYAWAAELRSPAQMMIPQPPPVFIIPGMHVGCTPFQAFSGSTLECFFDPACLNVTAGHISTLPSSAWPKPLNPLLPSHFSRKATISEILAPQMVEEWSNARNFTNYYGICAPSECTYTFKQRNEPLYVLTTLIGLFGGLIVSLRILAPMIVQLFRTVRNYFASCTQSSSDDEQEQQRGCCARLTALMVAIKSRLLSLNLFEDDVSNERLAIRTTRIYVLLLITSAVIMTFYSALTVNTRSITVSTPSRATFELLKDRHPLTLTCRCNQLTVLHEQMITVSSPRYHQICTSTFLSSVWLNDFFDLVRENPLSEHPVPQLDFRIDGLYTLRSIGSQCQLAAVSIANSQAVFVKEQFVSAEALSRVEFAARTESLISVFKTRTANYLIAIVSMMRLVLLASGTQNRLSYSSLLFNGSWRGHRYSPAPSSLNDCACSASFKCSHPRGHIWCTYGNNCTIGTVGWTTPGMFQGCTDLESQLTSDLHCFFDQACVDALLATYNYDMPNRPALSPSTLAVRALSSSMPTRFKTDDTLGALFDQLMIEEWNITGDFDAYYGVCAPNTCTYTFSQRLDIVHVVATLVGLFGGLVVILRLLVPVGVQLIDYVTQRRHTNESQSTEERTPGIRQRFNALASRAKTMLLTMNLFQKESSISRRDNAQHLAVVSSRVYVVLLTLSVLILGLSTGLGDTTTSVTVPSPSLDTFERLQATYPTGVSCPCLRVAVPYRAFLTVTASYHQVCSSAFVQTTWITSLYGYGNGTDSRFRLDRPLLSKQHQIVGRVCEEALLIVEHAVSSFNDTTLISTLALPRDSFVCQTSVIIREFTAKVPISFKRIVRLITELIAAGAMPSTFNTDWLIEFGNSSNGYLMRNVPRPFANGTCNCLVSDACQEPMRIGVPDLVLPGLVIGCSPLHSLRRSTLECFFSSTCINTILSYLHYDTLIDGSPASNFTLPEAPAISVAPLDRSSSSRFLPNTSIGTLIDELFIEQWNSSSAYESYFQQCAPSFCRYDYVQRKNGFLVIISLLALYGGLTIALRFIVWNTVRFYPKVRKTTPAHRINVNPRPSISAQ